MVRTSSTSSSTTTIPSTLSTSTRKANYNSDIEGSLFGTNNHHITNRSTNNKNAKSISRPSLVNKATLTRLGINVTATTPSKDNTISIVDAEEYNRIHSIIESPITTNITSPSTAALDRKQRILSIQPVSNFNDINADADDKQQQVDTLNQAKTLLEEEHDEVKNMNQLMLYAQCVTIRDAQIRAKQLREQEEKQQIDELDQRMEQKRIIEMERDLRIQQEKERERRAGAATIIEQIKERERDRLKEQEQIARESAELIKNVLALEEEENQKLQNKIKQNKILLQTVALSNAEQAREKLELKKKELIEEKKRLAYIEAKEARDRQLEQEALNIRLEKEKEVARLRAQQERAKDRQSALDEIRARRYQQEKDRQYRTQMITKQNDMKQMMTEIAQIRAKQMEEKQNKTVVEREADRLQVARLQTKQQEQFLTEQEAIRAKKLSQKDHQATVKEQMARNAAEKLLARQAYLAEGNKAAIEREKERQKLEVIRAEKVSLLAKMGVPEKYTVELKKKKILESSVTK